MSIRGRMYMWFKKILTDRSISVRIHTSFSDKFFLENGIPQGSVISPTLFLIMVNDLESLHLKSIPSQFADDTSIHKSGRKNLI